MCIEENRDGVADDVGVMSFSRGVIACSDFGDSIREGPCDEGARIVLMEASEEWNIGLMGNSERARVDVEGDGSVNLGLMPVFAYDEVAWVCFGGSIGEDFTDRAAFGSSSEGLERIRVGLMGDVGIGWDNVEPDGVVSLGLIYVVACARG